MTVLTTEPSLKTVYEQDYSLWLEMTAEQLRAGRLENLDIENLLEEIEAMARKEKVALESNLEVLLMHYQTRLHFLKNRPLAEQKLRLLRASFRSRKRDFKDINGSYQITT